MKKSLIALAVLAASGASFAQVSVTGNLTYGYQSTTTGLTPGSTDQAGFGAETANVAFTAKEDLGGGYNITANLKINTAPGGAGVTGDDHSLVLATPFGGLVMGTAKGPDYLSGGVAGVGAYYDGWDGKIFTARTQRDFIAYVIPVGALTLRVVQLEGAGSIAFGTGGTGNPDASIGGGSSAPVTALSATYVAGPLEANGMYLLYKNTVGFGRVKDITRLSASYDLGVAKLGAGVAIATHDNTGLTTLSPKTTDYMLGAKVPMGASSFGLTFVSRTLSDVGAATSATVTGYSLEYGYAMSKRTSVIANYARWTQTPANSAVNPLADASSKYQLLLSHSF